MNFNASTSSDPDGSIASYAWVFGDGATATGVSTSRAYASPGSYVVRLTVTDNRGAATTAQRTVNVTAAPQPDLVPSAVNLGAATVVQGGSINVSWVMSNSGNASVGASTTGIRLLSASTSDNGTPVNTLISVNTGALAAGGTVSQNQNVTIPANTAPGSYVILVIADNANPSMLNQSNAANDYIRSAAFNVTNQSGAGASVPTLVAPGSSAAPGVTLVSYNPVAFSWNAAVNAASYALKIYDTNGSEKASFLPTGTTFTADLSGLSLSGYTFYWRLAACNTSAQCSNQSAPFYFQFPVPVIAPNSPTGLSPQGNAGATTLALSWSAVSGATSYQYEISGTGLQTPIAGSGGGTTSDNLNLSASGSYAWKVKACNSAGCSGYANTSFSTPQPSLPATPTGLAPGSTNQNSAPTTVGTDIALGWSPVSGASDYSLKLYNSNGQTVVSQQAIGSGSNYNASNLSAGLYSWEVASCSLNGCSAYSNRYYFRMQAPAPLFAVTSLSQSSFNTSKQSHGSPSGSAYIANIVINGTSLDTAQQITWSWDRPSQTSVVWTKNSQGGWANLAGQARTASIVSSTQINASPALVAITDTWTGTSNWTVQVCNSSNVCSSAYFTVSRN